MRFFNFYVTLILVTLATSAIASENKRAAYQHSPTHGEFNSAPGETSLASATTYSDDYLEGSFGKILEYKTTILHQQYSQGSFQAETEFQFPLNQKSTGHDLYSGVKENIRDSNSHGDFNKDHERENEVSFRDGHEQYEGHWNHGDWGDRVSPPVPEPESYVLMLVGLMMLGALKYRKS